MAGRLRDQGPRYRDRHHGGFQRREAEQGADPNIAKAFGVEWISAFAPLLMLPVVLVLKSWNVDELWASELDGQS